MSRRRYATDRQTRALVDQARKAGLDPGAVEFKPNGSIVVIDRGALAPSAKVAPVAPTAQDADAALDRFLEAQNGADPHR